MSAEISHRSYLINTPLHAAIVLNDYRLFKDFLSSPNIDVDERNEIGDTPLLVCLKLRHADFAMQLLSKKCDVNIPNNKNKTPLSLVLKNRNYYIAHKLIAMGANFDVSYDVISGYFHEALLERDWSFIVFVLRHRPDFVLSVLLGVMHEPALLADVVITLCELEQHLSRHPYRRRFNSVGACLVQFLLKNGNFLTFKYYWPHLDQQCICRYSPTFLQRFLKDCDLSNEDCVECLNMILDSPYAFQFFKFYKERGDCESFFDDVLEACVRCGVDSDVSLSVLRASFVFIKATSYDMLTVYTKYGINDATLLILSALNRKALVSNVGHHKFAYEFLNALEKDNTVESKYVSWIGLIASRFSRNFKNWFDKTLHENVYLKRQSRHRKVPSLLDISACATQRYIQQTQNFGTPDEFQNVINNLCLPPSAKRRLCFGIPVCYKTN